MSTRNDKQLIVLGAVAALLAVSGCTTTNPYTGQSEVSSTAKGTGLGAAAGAIGGALLGGKEGALIGAGIGGLGGAAVGSHMDKENAALRHELQGTGVQVIQQGNQIKLVMSSDVTFQTNSSNINAQFYRTLTSVAKVIKAYKDNNVVVSGFTDSTGAASYNQTLSEKRAASVGAYLVSQGVNQNRVFTQGFGERHPIASNASAAGRAKNRRVEIVLRKSGT